MLIFLGTFFCQTRAATITWTNTAGGNWNTAANWSPNQVPGPSDTALVSVSSAVTLNTPTTVSNVTFTGGALNGSGSLTVAGTMNWLGGDLSGASLLIAGGGTLNISNIMRFGYNNGSGNGGGALTNFGTVVWAAGAGVPMYGYGGAIIYNAGLWQAITDNALNNSQGTNTFLNAGTFQKAGGTGQSQINWPFNTTGTLATPTGTLYVEQWTGANTLHGAPLLTVNSLRASLNVASDGVLNWLGGDISGGALTIAAGGTLNISNIMRLGYNGGAGNGGGALTNFGTVNWAAGAGVPIYGHGGAAIYNAGLWQALTDNALNNSQGTNTFINAGVFQKTAGAGQTQLYWPFNTTGTLSTLTGSLYVEQWTDASTLHGTAMLQLNSLGARLLVANDGVMNWLGGDITGGALTIAAGGTLTISNVVRLGYNSGAGNGGGALTNFGNVIWGAGPGVPIYGHGGATIYNAGLWQAPTDNAINNSQGTNTFLNAGSLQKTGGSGVSYIYWNYTGTGALGTLSGTLDLDQWVGPSSVSSIANLAVGTLSGPVTFLSGAALNVSGGLIKGSLTVASNALMIWKGSVGEVNGGNVTVAGGGTLTISNTVRFGYNSGANNGGGTLTNFGTVNWAGSASFPFYGYGGATIYNAGLWQAFDDGVLNIASGTNTFLNTGTLQKAGGSGQSQIYWNFTTTGALSTPSGTLYFDQWVGANTVPSIASISFGTLTGTATLVSGAAVGVSGGVVTGSLTVAGNALMNWNGGPGEVNGGALTVSPGGTLSISNTIRFGYNSGSGNGGGALTNLGMVLWGGSASFPIYGYGGGRIYNAGLWQAFTDNSLSTQQGTNAFLNNGTFQKAAGAGASSIGWDFTTSGTTELRTGTLSLSGAAVQNGGLTRLAGGNLSSSQPFQLSGGTLAGTNTFTGTLTNSAVVSPGASPGLLTISGTYVQTPSGTLNIELGGTNAGVDYDRLTVSGSATLAGTLNITLIDPYLPAVSNLFRVLTYSSFSGNFSTVNGLVLSSNLLLQATSLANSLDLVAATNTNQLVTAPSIVAQPQNQTIINGQSASFAVTAAGTRPLAYQWQHYSTNLPGATTSALSFANAQTNLNGDYRAIVTNSSGSATSAVAVLTVVPIADLVVTTIVNPTNADAAQPFTVSWRSLNQGSQSAASPWTESVALSTNANGDSPIPLASFVFHDDLAAGQSIVRTQSVIAPAGLDGNYYLAVSTDKGNQVYEADNETNNTTVGATPIRLRSPDLLPAALSAAPASAQFGAAISFSWTTTNAGSGQVQVAWTDRVYLGPLSNSLSGATSLVTALITNLPVAAGSVVSNSASLTLPLSSQSSNGVYYLLVSTDDGNTVAESRETNNLASRAISLSLPPLPDLLATNVSAPTQILAGAAMTLRWTVTNAGTADLISKVWTESVSISNAAADITLAELLFTNTLHAGESLSRTQQVTVPTSLLAGNYRVSITVDAFNDIVEGNEGNNSTLATNISALPAQLELGLPAQNVNEGGPPFFGMISRNGSFSQPLFVAITNSRPDKVAVTNLVVIPAGWDFALFLIIPLADGVVDADQLVTLTAGATNYADASAALTVQNIDLPALALNFPSPTLPKGQSFLASISRPTPAPLGLTVFLSSSSVPHLTVPASVVIPSNQTSVSFLVAAVDNGLIEGTLTNQVTAAATGFVPATASVALLDTDFPTVVLSLAASTISEGAGPQATLATVRRSPVAAYPIVLDLVSSNPNKALVPASVVIPGGLPTVSFPVAAVNNNTVDGDQVVQLHIFIRATDFNGDVAEGTGASLLVTDDDGPALGLALNHDVVAEGLSPALTATVTRNTSTNSSLLVNLTNSRPDKASVPVTVTIPAGAAGASFNVTTLSNAIADGNQTVALLAGAAGFASAAASFVVSDFSLPDLTITQLSAVTNAQTDAYFSLNYSLQNQGFLDSGSNLVTRFYLSRAPVAGTDILLGDAVFSGSLPAGQSFGQALQFRLPSTAGQYWVVAVADPDNKVSELREDNNTRVTTLPIVVQTAYTATLQASVITATVPTNVVLSGLASLRSGGPAQFAAVSIHIFLRGTERVIQAITDATGHFSTTFTPLPNEAGSYLAAAAHPGEVAPAVQVAFTLLGLKLTPPTTPPVVIAGSSTTGAVDVVNLGDTPLTSLAGSVVAAPGNLSVALSLSTNRVEAQSTVKLGYTITAIDASQPQGFVQLRVISGEGPLANATLGVSVWPLHSQLAAVPGSLTAAMPIGGQQQVQFSIVNQGGAASGPITLSLPATSWLTLASVNPLPSLAPGESNLVTLLLTPAAELPLGPYAGSLVAGTSDSAVSVPLTFIAMTQARGSLRITAQDEFSFYATGAPNVANAAVVIRDPVTLAVVTNGLTGTNGQFFVPQLPEAFYNVEITATQHTSYKSVVHVLGGITNDLAAFLSRQLVQYTWSVVPTTIEDRTRITIATTFETFVPAPVVTIDPPLVDLADYGTNGGQVVLTVQNHGLVAANGFRFLPVTHPNWLIQPLISDLGDIPAGGSLSIPVTLQPLNPGGPNVGQHVGPKAGSGGAAPCGASLLGAWHLECGEVEHDYGSSVGFMNAGNCGGTGISALGAGGGASSGGGGSGGGTVGGGGGGTISWPFFQLPAVADFLASLFQPTVSRQQPTSCNPCLNARNDAAFQCVVDLINPFPLLSCFKGAFDCGQSIGQGEATLTGAAGCLGALPGCSEGAESLMKKIPGLGEALALISCGCAICNACKDLPGDNTDCKFCDFNPFGGSTHTAIRPRALVAGAATGGDLFAPLIAETEKLQNIVAPMIYYFGSNIWLQVTNGDVLQTLMDQFTASIGTNTDGGRFISSAERATVLAQPRPYPLAATDVNAFLDRWNRTMTNYANSIFYSYQVPANGITNFIAFDQWLTLLQSASETVDAYKAAGITDPVAFWFSLREGIFARQTGTAAGTCAQVKLQLDQDLVLARNAFKATLKLDNQSSTLPLSNIKVLLNINDNNGLPANNLFSIGSPIVAGLGAVDGTGSLVVNGSGTVSWTLVPTRQAATNGPTVYGVGGVLQYTQEGRALTIPLFSAPITVYPDPALYVKYFHQRDVYADDPFTPQIEPSIPFVLGVMVENRGKGSANDLRITSSQPEIVDNEKGLAIGFKIIGSLVAGQPQTPSLTAEFGALSPGARGVGLWFLTSTLQGLFLDYQASLQHVDDLGLTNSSLIDELTIHEMIHLVQAPGAFEDGQPDFLVNDSPDLDNLPDRIYLSDGTTNPVFSVTQATVDSPAGSGHLTVQLTAQMPAGWTYLEGPDPGNGQFTLTRVVRSDGVQLYLNTNVWTTDRTFVGGGHPPVRENLLHLLDYGSTGSYLLYYQPPPVPDATAPTSAVAALPANSYPQISLSWSGSDNAGGSGIAFFDIFASIDGAPFAPWLQRTTFTSSLYPGQLGHTYAFYSLATDAAGNSQSPPAQPNAQTAVTLTNSPPSILAATNVVMDEGQTLSLAVPANDPDPGQALTFSLGPGAPPSLNLNPATGLITWLTTEATDPATNQFLVIVTDNGQPPLSATSQVTIVVREVNQPPILAPITNYTISEGSLLLITNLATDPDIPANSLAFSLGPGAPNGTSINGTNGIFQWQPSNTQGPSTNPITIIVTDNGVPPLSATQQFSIIVLDTLSDFTLSFSSTNVLAGESNTLPLILRASLPLTNITLQFAAPWTQLTNLGIQPLAAEVSAASLSLAGSNLYAINLNLNPALQTASVRPVATLDFLAVSNEHSAVVFVVPSQLLARQSGGTLVTNGTATSGRVFVVSREPILDMGNALPLQLTLYGQPGTAYALLASSNLSQGAWISQTNLTLTNRSVVLPVSISGAPARYFRSQKQ